MALLVAGYLVGMYWTGQISHLRGCGEGEGCANLLGGQWGTWFLVPISFWALLAYVALLVLIAIGLDAWWSRMLALSGGLLLLLAAGWFMVLQAFVEKHFCLYCCVMHACGAVIAGVLLHAFWTRDFPGRWQALKTASALSLAATTALIAGQLWGPQPATHETRELTAADLPAATPPDLQAVAQAVGADPGCDSRLAPRATGRDRRSGRGSAALAAGLRRPPAEPAPVTTPPPPPPPPQRMASFLDGKLRYVVGEMPMIGDPAAEHMLVKYFDYTCEACRDMHEELEKVRRLYPRKFAVIVVPTPLNRTCNPNVLPGVPDHLFACELARLALAVWRANPARFAEFHEALFRQQGRITPAEARGQAIELVGFEALQRAEQDPWIEDVLAQSAATYRALGIAGILPHAQSAVRPKAADFRRAARHGRTGAGLAAGIQARLNRSPRSARVNALDADSHDFRGVGHRRSYRGKIC